MNLWKVLIIELALSDTNDNNICSKAMLGYELPHACAIW